MFKNSSRVSYKHLKDAVEGAGRLSDPMEQSQPGIPQHNLFSPNNMTTTLNQMMMLGSTVGSGDIPIDSVSNPYNETAKQGIMPYNPTRQQEPGSAMSTQDAHHQALMNNEFTHRIRLLEEQAQARDKELRVSNERCRILEHQRSELEDKVARMNDKIDKLLLKETDL